MTICIPTVSDAGQAARLSPHFGRAPWFTLTDAHSRRAEVFPNARARHEPGQCDAAEILGERPIDVVVCRGMGPTALEQLRARGVVVLATDAWTVSEAVRAFREGRLTRLVPHSR